MNEIDEEVKYKLAQMVEDLDATVESFASKYSDRELNHLLEHYSAYLKLDLLKVFKAAQKERSLYSPFDDILEDSK